MRAELYPKELHRDTATCGCGIDYYVDPVAHAVFGYSAPMPISASTLAQKSPGSARRRPRTMASSEGRRLADPGSRESTVRRVGSERWAEIEAPAKSRTGRGTKARPLQTGLAMRGGGIPSSDPCGSRNARNELRPIRSHSGATSDIASSKNDGTGASLLSSKRNGHKRSTPFMIPSAPSPTGPALSLSVRPLIN